MLSPQSLFGWIESGNFNPSSAWDYQQGKGFIEQFGSGTAGFDNWLTQALTANPDLSIGDAYAQYNSGTGTPGFGNSWQSLADINPSAYANASQKFAAAGINPASPLSSLGGGGLTTPSESGQNQYGGYSGSGPAGSAGPGQGPGSVLGAGGSGESFWQALSNWIDQLVGRGALMIIGIILIAAAIFLMSNHGFDVLKGEKK